MQLTWLSLATGERPLCGKGIRSQRWGLSAEPAGPRGGKVAETAGTAREPRCAGDAASHRRPRGAPEATGQDPGDPGAEGAGQPLGGQVGEAQELERGLRDNVWSEPFTKGRGAKRAAVGLARPEGETGGFRVGIQRLSGRTQRPAVGLSDKWVQLGIGVSGENEGRSRAGGKLKRSG